MKLLDEIMTTQEVAVYLKMHVKTVARLARIGRLPGAKLGKGWRFKRSGIDMVISGLSEESGVENE